MSSVDQFTLPYHADCSLSYIYVYTTSSSIPIIENTPLHTHTWHVRAQSYFFYPFLHTLTLTWASSKVNRFKWQFSFTNLECLHRRNMYCSLPVMIAGCRFERGLRIMEIFYMNMSNMLSSTCVLKDELKVCCFLWCRDR